MQPHKPEFDKRGGIKVKKRFICILLFLVASLCCHAFAAVPPTLLDHLPDSEQRLLDYTLEQAAEWAQNYEAVYGDMDALFNEELIKALSALRSAEPSVAYFFRMHAPEAEASTFRLHVGSFLSQSLYANILVRPLEGALLDGMSAYGVYPDDDFSGMCSVVLYYGEELPVMVTTICEVSEGQSIAKTGPVYAYGQYGNEFTAFAGSLVTRFGEEMLDISYYPLTE